MRLFILCLVAASVSLAHAQTVTFSSYLGVADCDGIAIGADGDLYLACHSPSAYLPVEPKPPKRSGEQRGTDPYFDAYVLRIDPRKDQLIYATRLGGSDYDESSRIMVDQHGFAWVLGYTKSRDFPTTPDAIQRNYGGGEGDGFLAKLAPDGRVVYATYLGGNGDDNAYALELDGVGGAFVGGWTNSDNFPGRSTPKLGHKNDAYIAHIDPEHPGRFHSMVFGGQEDEMLTGLALDRRGGLFATGSTKSKDFPTLHPTQGELRGTEDAFLVRFIANSLTPTFSTYFGGSGDTSAWGITVNRHGDPIIAGATDAGDLPTNMESFQRTKSGGDTDTFIARFAGGGYRHIQATYLGGTQHDFMGADGEDIKIAPDGTIWFVGQTSSLDFPTRKATQPRYGGGEADGFIAALSPDLRHLCYSSYRGGSDRDWIEGLDISRTDSSVFTTGATESRDLPLPAKGVQTSLLPVNVDGIGTVNAMVFGLSTGTPCR